MTKVPAENARGFVSLHGVTTIDHRTTSRRKRRYALIGLIGIAALAGACGSSGSSGSGGNAARSTTSSPNRTSTSTSSKSGNTGSVTSSSVPAPSTSLSTALTSAYQAETAALATYRNVVSTLGSVLPFPNVITAEQQHVSTLTGLFAHYGLAVPTSGTGQTSPSTRTAACQLGVTVEQQIISLYDTQLPKVSAYPDVTTAFTNLKAASQNDHLPAFQHCA